MIQKNKLKNISAMIIVFVSILSLSACKTKQTQTTTVEETSKYQNYQKAKIAKTDLDGCSWTILLDETGKRLEPINLTDEFKIDSLNIWLQFKNFDGNSICMMGQMVTITAIAKR